jgi:hypothetical protein
MNEAVKTIWGPKWKALDRNDHISTKTLKFCSCGWRRELSSSMSRLLFDHPQYGIVSGDRMAELDVLNHRCEQYRDARRALHG